MRTLAPSVSSDFDSADHGYMQMALDQADMAQDRGEVPIGAVLVDTLQNRVVAAGGNRTIEYHDPTAHAEILVIRAACKAAGAQRIPGLHLYVTLEPCTMCAAAISFARIARLIFGADDPKGGGVLNGARFFDQDTCHHKPDVSHGLMAQPCGQILKDFFRKRRAEKKEN